MRKLTWVRPCRLGGAAPSPASDLWSFGLMLFEAVFPGVSTTVDPHVGGRGSHTSTSYLNQVPTTEIHQPYTYFTKGAHVKLKSGRV